MNLMWDLMAVEIGGVEERFGATGLHIPRKPGKKIATH